MSASSSNGSAHKQAVMGRPRAVPRESTQDVADEILDVAARLFIQQGYEGTSTRQIAEEVGLKQGSLFHHFARKSDMLTELLDRTLQPAMELVDVMGATSAPYDVGLFMLVYADVKNICGQRRNLASLMYLPVVRSPEFEWFWEKRSRLLASYHDLIQRGSAATVFIARDAELSTAQVFGLVESTILWFDRDGRWPSDMVADEIATTALRMMLVDTSEIEDIKTRAFASLLARPTPTTTLKRGEQND
ncbi:TetR/AcrR family transcriptional regulator [Ensifer sp. 4252]|uniref:TetR/AcrR family transcriptional regulator n=1 Tax=Ensifer sp. 4252 TaxID=3373915 RepID=UPI003D1D60B4